MDIKGRTVLVTGGNSGIGRAISMVFAERGANVCITYNKSEDEAIKTVKEIEKLDVRVKAYKTDISSEEQVTELINFIERDFGNLCVLVNCAGKTHIIPHNNLYEMKSQYFDEIFNVNVKGTFFCCREAKRLLEKEGGVIVNITSTAGLNGLGSSIAYAASKAAEINMTRSLARVFAPAVRVLSVAPGLVKTRFSEGLSGNYEKNASESCLKRLVTPEEIADVVDALVCGNEILTGITVVADGGRVF